MAQRLIVANVNGIRAAARRGGLAWLRSQNADVIALQEVRASTEQLAKVLADEGLGDYHLAHAESDQPGRAGVAVLARKPIECFTVGLPADVQDEGRWLEAVVDGRTFVSAYVHTGEADTPRQDAKYAFLDAMEARLLDLPEQSIVTGDFNIAHREVDIKNWKGNLKKSGFLPAERAYLDRWLATWVDLGRVHGGPGPGPYTWWSWRGKAFDNDAGWRIDYALASPQWATGVTSVTVGKAPTYAERWSDHAPVIVDYE